MIDRFQEHAANERTFLSWTRTAIAVAGFGVLIEKLPNTATQSGTGIVLVGLSALLIATSTLRFLVIRFQLRRRTDVDQKFAVIEGLFAGMLTVLLLTVFVFLIRLLQ